MGNKLTISILGCGWLGYPLAIKLISRGFHVKGSTTSPVKLPMFKSAGIDPYLVKFDSSSQEIDLSEFLTTDVLVISIPPGKRRADALESYRKMAHIMRKKLEDSPISKLIFISSTSVYPESNSVLDEFSEIAPETDSGKILAETEALFSELDMQVIVLRLSGLVGPNRMPGRFFSGQTNIANGLSPVNMIHLDDAIALINSLIDSESARGVYLGCSPSHPNREEFYTLAAEMEKLNLPSFIHEKQKWKEISSVRTVQELNFSYKYPSLIDWLKKSSN